MHRVRWSGRLYTTDNKTYISRVWLSECYFLVLIYTNIKIALLYTHIRGFITFWLLGWGLGGTRNSRYTVRSDGCGRLLSRCFVGNTKVARTMDGHIVGWTTCLQSADEGCRHAWHVDSVMMIGRHDSVIACKMKLLQLLLSSVDHRCWILTRWNTWKRRSH